MSEASLTAILGPIFVDLRAQLQADEQKELVQQLDKVIVPVQKLGGDRESFSFMAFPYPRLTTDERKNLSLIDERSHCYKCHDIDIRIDIDQFGQINWLYITNAPNLYQEIIERLGMVSEGGGTLPFWRH